MCWGKEERDTRGRKAFGRRFTLTVDFHSSIRGTSKSRSYEMLGSDTGDTSCRWERDEAEKPSYMPT